MDSLILTFGYDFQLAFDIHNTSIAARWVEALQAAQAFPYPIDDPKRFYGFEDPAIEQANALARINKTIETINSYDQLIVPPRYKGPLTDCNDQDQLNYLHHIFEVFHGVLDQHHEFYLSAPPNVRKALGDLNTDVHRCESAARGNKPRLVLTWYGLPKTRQYTEEDFALITNDFRFGEVYVNYVEIGKTLEDLCVDRDNYIHPAAFRPLLNFSADFTIKFFDANPQEAHNLREKAWQYYEDHYDEFVNLGYGCNNLYSLEPGRIPVATLNSDLSQEEILAAIRNRQHVTKVELV